MTVIAEKGETTKVILTTVPASSWREFSGCSPERGNPEPSAFPELKKQC